MWYWCWFLGILIPWKISNSSSWGNFFFVSSLKCLKSSALKMSVLFCFHRYSIHLDNAFIAKLKIGIFFWGRVFFYTINLIMTYTRKLEIGRFVRCPTRDWPWTKNRMMFILQYVVFFFWNQFFPHKYLQLKRTKQLGKQLFWPF